MNITISWWVTPSAITVLSLVWVFINAPNDSGVEDRVVFGLTLLSACALSLIVWLIGAVLK